MKKLSWLLCLIVMLVVVPVSSTFAESTVSYDSKASVGFYGEYVYPEEPSEEGGGINSSTGGNKSISHSSITPGKSTTVATLPQTGDIASSQTTLIGLLLISATFVGIYKRKQKTT